ncbi:unnamed protein product [Musa textilis]
MLRPTPPTLKSAFFSKAPPFQIPPLRPVNQLKSSEKITCLSPYSLVA